uniref:Reverse transcriptase domain-containing protein n=1 Tax=Schistocephalus solidus TaxID=70667 RepID=A0A183SWC9_SCHSO
LFEYRNPFCGGPTNQMQQSTQNPVLLRKYAKFLEYGLILCECRSKGSDRVGLKHTNKLKCLYTNVQSLLPKLHELKIFVCQTSPDIISITETWLTAKVDDREVAIPGFQLFRKDITGRHGGSVLTYVRYAIWLTIRTPGFQALEILTVYQPPRNDPQSDSRLIYDLESFASRAEVMIMGDFNAPNIDWNMNLTPGSELNFDRCLLEGQQWLTNTLKRELNLKRKLWQTYLREKTAKSLKRYKTQRNRFKGLVYKCTRNKDPIPLLKTDEGVEPCKDEEKAEHLSEFFQSIFTRVANLTADNYSAEEIPTIDSVVIAEPIVLQELLKLDETKSPGHDVIPAKLLKELAVELAKPLSSIAAGRLPPDWKTAWISPIHKSRSRASVNNYRPVSLTSICCKIMERIIKRELMQFLERHHLLSEAQHGFRRGMSGLTNLLYCLERWIRVVDEGNVVHAVYIDFKKAFDSVPHQRLLYKINRIGVRGKLVKWIENFLIGRSQIVRLGDQRSVEVAV